MGESANMSGGGKGTSRAVWINRAMWPLVCFIGVAITIGVGYGLTEEITFVITGLIGGLLSGVVWMLLMLRVRSRQPRRNLIWLGVSRGIMAGLLATFILWSPIIIKVFASGKDLDSYSDGFGKVIALIAAICAVVGGTVTGGICGVLWEGLLIKSANQRPRRSG